MKPLFVRINDGQPNVQWRRLAACSAAVMLVTAVLVEGTWYLLSSHLSLGALIVAIVLGALVVTRLVVRAVTYQEQELEVEASSARVVTRTSSRVSRRGAGPCGSLGAPGEAAREAQVRGNSRIREMRDVFTVD